MGDALCRQLVRVASVSLKLRLGFHVTMWCEKPSRTGQDAPVTLVVPSSLCTFRTRAQFRGRQTNMWNDGSEKGAE